jgi:hypothetical protein
MGKGRQMSESGKERRFSLDSPADQRSGKKGNYLTGPPLVSYLSDQALGFLSNYFTTFLPLICNYSPFLISVLHSFP